MTRKLLSRRHFSPYDALFTGRVAGRIRARIQVSNTNF
jgi:hypothetical protein